MPDLAGEGGRKACWGAIRVRANGADGPGDDNTVMVFTDDGIEILTDLI